MSFVVCYMIIDLGVKAALVERCARFAVAVEIPQRSLSSVNVFAEHRDSLAQILGSAVLNALCKSLPHLCRCFGKGCVDLNKDIQLIVYTYSNECIWNLSNTTGKQVILLTPIVYLEKLGPS